MSKETLEKTVSTLDETLVNILEKAVSTGEKATKFLVEQTPMVVQEMLNWYFAYHFILFIAGTIFLFVVTPILYSKLIHKSSAQNWLYDKDGDLHDNPRVLVPILTYIPLLIIAISSLNLQWLKIWIAPKLFLIEKLAQLTS